MINVQMNPDAFPHEFKFGDGTANRSNGMTLRDYFAAQAIGAAFEAPIPCTEQERAYIAKHAYALADAMLKARAA